ncbi:MAG: zinc-binding dehydrogenase [Bifidobacterium sp.]|jgi:NADPH:quinone reductase-like Zn-dependent oxidoreductase|nr:zinc-binding dehydrogenase [Bifidobacterium sp.]
MSRCRGGDSRTDLANDGQRDVEPLKAKSITWHWELMFTRPVQHTPDMVAQHELLGCIADLVDEGRLRTTVTRTLMPITAATLRQAHELVESGHTIGKIVVADWK